MKANLTQSAAMSAVAALFCAVSPASAQAFQAPPTELVSAWKLDGQDVVVVFRHDGTYHFIQADGEDLGLERGTFTWDKATGAFSVETVVDTNGEAGLSHPEGATTASIVGNTLTYTVAGEGSFILNRVVNTASAIVGSWLIPGEKISVTFLGDGTYYLAEEANDPPFGYTGIEKGTYAWNSVTKALSATATVDTNGDVGINGVPPGVTVNITGNKLVFDDGEEITDMYRVVTNPTPITLPDYGLVRIADFVQTSDVAPAPQTFDPDNGTAPYVAEAFVNQSVAAAAPTLKIGAGSEIALDEDEPGEFETEEIFSSLAGLNAFLPFASTVQFKEGAGTASLTSAPNPGSFPTTPKLLFREGNSWSGGVYRFGADEVLQWTLPVGFTASQFATSVNVFDPTSGEDKVNALLQGDITFFDLAGKLDPSTEYEVEIEFLRIDNSNAAGTGVFAGKQGHALSSSITTLRIESRSVVEFASFTSQPQSQQGTPGSQLFLNAGVNEEAFSTSTFQWFRNGTAITGQTASSLYIPNFNPDDHSGRYFVTLSNPGGDDASQVADVGNVGTEERHVQSIVISKRKTSEQKSAVLLEPLGAGFDVRVEGPGLDGTFPSSNMSFTHPNDSELPLTFDEDHWDSETDFADLNTLQAAFPDGGYLVNIGGDSVGISMAGSNYPNQPLISSTAGTWVDGKLRITASQAAAGFSLSTNATLGDGFVTLYVIDSNDNDVLSGETNVNPGDPDELTVAVPPGELAVGESFEVEVEFDEVIDAVELSQQSWGAPPEGTATAFGLLSTITVFTLEVVPDPAGSPYETWRAAEFTTGQLADPAISGDDADFDKDGLDTLVEFILGGSPTAANPNLLKSATTTPAPGGRNLVFFYDRKLAASGITQVVETSPTLSGVWTPAVNGVNGAVITVAPPVGDMERVTVTIPSAEPKLFVRLKASL